MKSLIYSFAAPLSLISFWIFTKWHYGLIVDANDVYFYGFPFIYKCEGLHTSMSTQYFIIEMATNFLCYFLFWLAITFILSRFVRINVPVWWSKVFWVSTILGFTANTYLSIEILDDRYWFQREFEIVIFDSDFTIFNCHTEDRTKYLTQLKNYQY